MTKILFIISSFNSLSQRAWVELDRLNYQVKVHTVSSEKKMIEAVREFEPELVLAPYLKTKIPAGIWKQYTCLVVHPGIEGDRGATSLDWAILNGKKEWGVTIIQAVEKMDAGPVWATENFQMRNFSKSFLYRHEITQAAIKALIKAVQLFEEKKFVEISRKQNNNTRNGKWTQSTNENDFKFSWNDNTAAIISKINAADSFPGALCNISGGEYYCYGVAEESLLKGSPGQLLARRGNAICIATGDAALWIRCLKEKQTNAIKLPASSVLGNKMKDVPVSSLNIFEDDLSIKTLREIWYEEANQVGYLHFDFYNGAMSTQQCVDLRDAFLIARERNTKIIVLMGGADIWSNGINLNVIEASGNPAQTSWENINAIDDLIREIICTNTHYIISALQGNAGAGGVSLALAADKVIAAKGLILNPHTRNMGLYGSEYWTYLLPRRIGTERANLFTEQCLPWGTDIALEVKLVDDCFGETGKSFIGKIRNTAEEIARLSYFPQLLKAKNFKRNRDENYKPLQKYRDEELAIMHKNFFENDWDYDYKRYCFVHKINQEANMDAVAGKDLFSERRKIWRRRKYEKLFYEV